MSGRDLRPWVGGELDELNDRLERGRVWSGDVSVNQAEDGASGQRRVAVHFSALVGCRHGMLKDTRGDVSGKRGGRGGKGGRWVVATIASGRARASRSS